MDLIIFEFLGALVAGTLAVLTMVFRSGHPTMLLRAIHSSPKKMPILAIRKTRSVSSAHHRKTSPPSRRGRSTVTFAGRRKKARTKTPDATTAPFQTPSTASATVSFDTCPSCGLQAPGSLLAEHFLGSPSHRNGPPKIVKVDAAEVEAVEEAREEDSKQSVRNLLQMLVPPRAFGRRHAHRSMGPISSIVKDLSPSHRRLS
jgi:hypothetical protein